MNFPNNIVRYIRASDAPVIVTWFVAATDDLSDNPDLQSNHNSGERFGVGDPVATVSYTVTDEAGNTATNSFTISVIVGKFLYSNG